MNPQCYFVVLIHFGSSQATDQALASLLRSTVPAQRIVVIDHDPQPYRWPDQSKSPVLVIRPARNSGYAAGVNKGLGVLVSLGAQLNDAVIVMNNDITLPPTSLASALRQLQQTATPTLFSLQTGYVNLFTGRAHLKALARGSSWYAMPYLDGAFLLSTYDTWLTLKGMPEHYFLYWEDIALSAAARQKGINLKKITTPIFHQTNTTPLPNKLYYLVRNGALFLSQQTPLPWRVYWQAANQLRYIYHSHSSKPKAKILKLALRHALHHKSGQFHV